MRSRIVGLAVAVTLFAVYWWAPIDQVGDSRYALLVSHSLVFERSLAIESYFPLPLNAHTHPTVLPVYLYPDTTIYPYQTVWLRDHLYYFYPPGTSLLSAPAVALARLIGLGPTGPGRFDYDGPGEVALQHILAALLTAVWGGLVFATCRLQLGTGTSALVALAAGLGTQALSTVSRAVWSDTWGLVLLQAALFLLLRSATPNPAVLGSLAGWQYLVRPTYSLAIVGILAILALRRQWRACVATGAVAAFWCATLVVCSYAYYGVGLPPYYWSTCLTFAHFWTGLVSNLVSPSRGLFVYVPAALVALSSTWRSQPQPVAAVAVAVTVAHLVATSGNDNWWGGYSYGPRLMIGVLPWLVLVVVQTVSLPRWRVAFAVAALAGVAVNVPGAFAPSTVRWNEAVNVDAHPERVLSWRDPQFLAWYTR